MTAAVRGVDDDDDDGGGEGLSREEPPPLFPSPGTPSLLLPAPRLLSPPLLKSRLGAKDTSPAAVLFSCVGTEEAGAATGTAAAVAADPADAAEHALAPRRRELLISADAIGGGATEHPISFGDGEDRIVVEENQGGR